MRDDNERTLFEYWQESLDEVWKRALDEDSEEEEFGTYACGFGRVKEKAPVKKSGIDDRLDKALKRVDARNSLGAVFDKILLGFTPAEEETRNPSHTDSARPSLASKLALTKSSSSQKRHEVDGSLRFAPSLISRKNSLRSNSGSLSDSVKRSQRSRQINSMDSIESF
jgi:hypothetical protein